MNPNNYGTRDACQRLVDAGIVLETEAVWIADEYPPFGSSMKILLKWDLRNKKELIFANFGKLPDGIIPAPSMAEVWRELPPQIGDGYLELGKNEIEGTTWACYVENINDCDEHDEVDHGLQKNTNPTDALIDLLIWVKAQKEGV
jgi:hypothetical protein